jgi:hypothetical protein
MKASQHKRFEPGGVDEPAGNNPGGFPYARADGGRQGWSPAFDFDYRVAIHEAGHVIAGYMQLSVAGSTIEFVDGHHGLTWSKDAALEPSVESVESICSELAPLMPGALDTELEQAHSHVVGWLDGIEAERLYCDELLPNTGHDLEAAEAIATLVCRSPASVDEYLAFARTEAIALLTDHRAAVLAVAAALVERRTLIGTEIDGVIGSVMPSPIVSESTAASSLVSPNVCLTPENGCKADVA